MRKKLIEVALPLEPLNVACKADKDRKTGSIRNLHKWFAPMPVPALRALIFAALVDDPEDDALRDRDLVLIERLVASVVEAPEPQLLAEARSRIRSSFSDGEVPRVFDPFCGGGSTLVEAQRLGLEAAGSDLNPVAVLISRLLTQYAPILRDHPGVAARQTALGTRESFGGFRADVRHYAARVRSVVWDKLARYYPTAPNGDPVSAWLWARTVPSPDPRFHGAPTPLVTNWWLSKNTKTRAFVVPDVDHASRSVAFRIATQGEPEEPAKNRCLFSNAPIDFAYVREQGRAGRLGYQMFAMVAQSDSGRSYFAPTPDHVTAAKTAAPNHPPTEELPERALSFGVQAYGLRLWAELFTPRQLLMLETFADTVANVDNWVREDGGDEDYALAVATTLALCVGKLAQFSTELAVWYTRDRTVGKVERAFAGHDVSMKMDFPEANPFAGGVGDWIGLVDTTLRAFDFVDPSGPPTTVFQADARTAAQKYDGEVLVVADPPYFKAIGYADVSDFFYIWHRRAIGPKLPDLFATLTTPKQGELIASPYRHGGSQAAATEYFVDGFTEVFSGLRRASRKDLPLVIIYAQKEQEQSQNGRFSAGWEAILEAIVRAGLSVTGTWPIRGTGSSRMIKSVGGGTSSLATYVALVCRPRELESSPTTRKEFMSALRAELGEALPRLRHVGIPPVDLAQAAIGPGMAVYSRGGDVIEADGSRLAVRGALEAINRVVDELLAEQEGDFDAPTRFALTWFQQHRTVEADFGDADSLARAKNTSVGALVDAGIGFERAGRFRLFGFDDLDDNWDAATDKHLTIWEVEHHMARRLMLQGEAAAAEVAAVAPAAAELARELAYRLFTICESKAWNKEALQHNALVVAWPEIVRLGREGPIQGRLEV